MKISGFDNEDDNNPSPDFEIGAIFKQLLTSPKIIFRELDRYEYNGHFYPLMALCGISSAFSSALDKSVSPLLSSSTVISTLISAVFFGGLLGWISFYVYAALVSWTGSWFNGRADTRSILRVFTYAMIPSIIASIPRVCHLLILKGGTGGSDGSQASLHQSDQYMIYACVGLEFLLGIWTVVLSIIGVGEVQEFSIGEAVLNLLSPAIAIVSFIMLIVGVGYLAK